MKSQTTRVAQGLVVIGWTLVLFSFFMHDTVGLPALALIALSSICFGLSLAFWNYQTEQNRIRDIKKPMRLRFSIAVLLGLTTIAACGLAHFLTISRQLRIDNSNLAEMELSRYYIAVDANANSGLFGQAMGDEQGPVPAESCGPSLDLAFYRPEDFKSSYPVLKMLRPLKGKSHIAIYISPQLVADSSFIAELEGELPHYAVFDRSQLSVPQEVSQTPANLDANK